MFFSAVIADDPECRVDADCPPSLTCMSETCKNPCITNNPCSSSQQCIVTNTQTSIRSVACICPEGTLAGYGGRCEQGNELTCLLHQWMAFWHFIFTVIATPECSVDAECGFTEKCQSGTCIPACKLISCGKNAQCTAQAHNARCECLPGYQGDPYSECRKGMLSIYAHESIK